MVNLYRRQSSSEKKSLSELIDDEMITKFQAKTMTLGCFKEIEHTIYRIL